MSTLKEGQIIKGEYKVVQKIGEGATAKVYLAYDLINEREVSLKVLKGENITERKIKSFQREARAISMLNHNNIIKIYKIDQTEQFHYIAQEYVEGITLKKYIENSTKVGIHEAQNIILQVLRGLEHAHQNKIVHKDIKSQNILLNVDNEVRITDFGIADILEDDVTKTQSLMGTPQYVAPEVLNKGESTVQTDIYSTGILLYELLIGSAPFKGEKPTVIIMKQLNQPLPSVKKQRDEIPQSLENVLVRATAKKLENRYKTATEMIEDLQTSLDIGRLEEQPLIIEDDFSYEGITITNLEDIKKIDQQEEKKKKRKVFLLIGLIILLLLTFISFFTFYSNNQSTMADLEGRTQAEALEFLETQGIDKEKITIEKQSSEEVEEGQIIKTIPTAGDVINKNTNVVLTVSTGLDPIILEDYVGKNIDEVQVLLEEKGLIVNTFYEISEKEEGTILSQTQEKGSELEVGDSIDLVVSQNIKKIFVINFLGMPESEVEDWINENDLNLVKEYECNDTYEDGVVFSQTPVYNKEVVAGDQIEIKVSNGTCPKEDTSKTTDDESVVDNG